MRVVEDQAFGIPSLTNILMLSVEGDDLAGLEDVISDDNYAPELIDGDSNSIGIGTTTAKRPYTDSIEQLPLMQGLGLVILIGRSLLPA